MYYNDILVIVISFYSLACHDFFAFHGVGLFHILELNVILQSFRVIYYVLTSSFCHRAQMSRMANLDPSWGLGNGLSGHVGTHWLKLFLSACKLLDLALALPTESLPQFQL